MRPIIFRIIFFPILFIYTGSWSQELTQIIQGQVVDLDSKTPVIGANVLVLNTDPLLGSSTDINGRFRIEGVPVGRQSLKVSSIGYEDVILNEILVQSGKQIVLSIEMKESVEQLDNIVIVATPEKDRPINSMANVSARAFSLEETGRYAASINDPARMAQSFAGVSAADDEGNEIVIRGNSARGLLWRLEGIEIPNPNHFSNGEGGSGGGISIIPNTMLAQSDFFTGAFPAEYGNALSGVFDLNFRKGNSYKREYALQLGTLGVQAALEGPFKKDDNASYLMNYRYSTLKMINKAGFVIGDETLVPEFQDLSFNLYLPTEKAGIFTIFGIGGLSNTGSSAERDSLEWLYRGDRFEEREYHKMAAVGITNTLPLKNNKTYIKSILSYSYEDNSVNLDSLDNTYELDPVSRESFEYPSLRLSIQANHKFNAKHVVRSGVIFSHLRYNLNSTFLDFDTNEFVNALDDSGNSNFLQAYSQWQFRPSTQWTINTGLHYSQLFLNNNLAIEPRAGITWQFSSNQSINAGIGLHSRPEPISIYLANVTMQDGTTIQPNKDIELTKSIHYVIGYDRMFGPDYHLKLELYYQSLFDVPVLNDSTSALSSLNFNSGFTNEDFVSEGTGKNYGIELTLEKFFSRNYYFMGTASLFESKYTALDQITRNTRFNSNYIFNLLGGKEFLVGSNKQNLLGANLRFMWRGGYRATPIDLSASIEEGSTVLDDSRAFEEKVPDYLRLDIGISYRKNKPKYSWILSMDIQNVTNRQNIYGRYYDSERMEIREITMVGLIPVINFRVEF